MKVTQTELFSTSMATKLADKGIKSAVSNAGDEWRTQCIEVFKIFLRRTPGVFMIEEFRAFASDKLPDPPSKRAFGFIPRFAKTQGWIEHKGHGRTKNSKAHGTPASLWQRVANVFKDKELTSQFYS